MPTFDGGHYFLTALIPISTAEIAQDKVVTSPVHALRKVLAMMPGTPTLAFDATHESPFVRSTACHFARFAIIDDVAYNGRLGKDAILGRIGASRHPAANNPVIAQPQDHLSRPYMLLAMDFDAADGSNATRDTFLSGLWNAMPQELGEIMRFCKGFGANPGAARFVAYVAACQIETTMPFNDYYIEDPGLPTWSPKYFLLAAGLGVIGLILGCLGIALTGLLMKLISFAVIVAAIALTAASLVRFAAKPFPAAQNGDATLPSVLKALYLQRVFTKFAIDNQRDAARPGGEAALHANFAAFLAAHRPSDRTGPTQAPGVLGI